MDRLVAMAEWLRGQGEMEFPQFVVAARAAGHNPSLWHAAKKAGLVTAEIRGGLHYIKAV